MDIFFLGRVLQEKFPELFKEVEDEELAAVDLALPDFCSDADRLRNDLLLRMSSLKPGDYDALLDCIAELREIFEHNREHLTEASEPLAKLLSVLSAKVHKLITAAD